jgi:hypothetical protein
MVTTKIVSSYRVTSADWIPMYPNEERLCVPALNNGGSNFDDAKDYNIDVESPSMDPAIRFQSLDISLDYEYMMPGSVRGGNVNDITIEEKIRQSLSLFGQDSITSPGSAFTSLEVLNQSGLLLQSSSADDGLWKHSLHEESPSTSRSSIPTPLSSAAFHFLDGNPPAKPKVTKPKKVMEEDILETDVLCGCGGKSNNHDGNKRYRHVIGDIRQQYCDTSSKNDKTALSWSNVEYVNCYGGRFLKKENMDQWVVVTTGEACENIAHALRETKALKWIE